MTFDEAIEQIKKEYEVKEDFKNFASISFDDVWLDGYNFGFVAIIYENEQVLLTDFTNCYECFYDIPDETIQSICKKHNILFINYHIECVYHSNEDIKRYKECLQEIAEQHEI